MMKNFLRALIGQDHPPVKKKVSTDEIGREAGEAENKEVRDFDRRHHLFYPRFSHHHVGDHLFGGDSPLFGLGRDLVQRQGGFDESGADRKRTDLSGSFR